MAGQEEGMARAAVVAEPEPAERRLAMSYEEWLKWSGESTQSEWVDGEAIVFMPPTIRHGRVSWFLSTLLGLFARCRGLGEVLDAPLEMRLSTRVSREPDLLFVAQAHQDRIHEKRVEGPADLVIELISDDSVTRDRVTKLREYEQAGIPEYWLVDPRPGRQRADFYRLADDETYRTVPIDDDGRYRSAVLPGFWLDVAWLWQDPLPNPVACLVEIAPDALTGMTTSAGGEDGA